MGGGEILLLCFFHVSEHIDHLKQEKNHQEKTGNCLVKQQTISIF